MCSYQGFEFGAGRYPDSVCISGRLWDADHCDGEGNLYDLEEDIPCPMCRPRDAIMRYYEQNYSQCGLRKDAMETAKSLVADIRKNRGVSELYGAVEPVHGYF